MVRPVRLPILQSFCFAEKARERFFRVWSCCDHVLPIPCPPRSVYIRDAQMTHRTQFHRQNISAFAPGGETSSLSTAHAETPRLRDRPDENTPHVRSYPAHAYPIENVATALQSTYLGRLAFFQSNAARHQRQKSARDWKYGS